MIYTKKQKSEPRELAVFLPQFGKYSETFIRRHVNDLAPGRTVAITSNKPGTYWKENCPSLRLERASILSLQRLITGPFRRLGFHVPVSAITTAWFLKFHGVQVGLGEYLHYSLQWFYLLKALGIRFFVRAHGIDVYTGLSDEKLRRSLMAYNTVDGIIVNTPIMRDQIKDIGITTCPIYVVPCGVDIPTNAPKRSRNGKIVRVLAVGRMVPFKAPINILKAIKSALKEGCLLHLDFVGEGPLLATAKEYVQSNGLQDKVKFWGAVEHRSVISLMQEADIFIHHSLPDPKTRQEETLGVAILEAMAHGIPVISTRSGGMPWVVDDGITGLLGQPGDIKTMAGHLIRLCQDDQLRISLGKAGYEKARKKFSWEAEKDALRRILGLDQ